MHLVVFDVDGTLVSPAHRSADDACFWNALLDVLELDRDTPHFVAGPVDITAVAIAAALCLQRKQRPMAAHEVEAFRDGFVRNLHTELGRENGRFTEVSGAGQLLDSLRAMPDMTIAIATGCFAATAQTKLRSAGVPIAAIPFASCDDGHTREAIMQTAHRTVFDSHGRAFDKVTYVGDGIWDVRAAANLGWDFIGVREPDTRDELVRAGARRIVADYADTDGFVELLRGG